MAVDFDEVSGCRTRRTVGQLLAVGVLRRHLGLVLAGATPQLVVLTSPVTAGDEILLLLLLLQLYIIMDVASF